MKTALPILSLLLILSMASVCWGQTSQQNTEIDGAKTPDLIPDSIGQRVYLQGISHFDTEMRAAYVANKVGLADPDRTLMINQIEEWATAHHALVEEYNKSGFTESAISSFHDGQDRLSSDAFSYLLVNLSEEGRMKLLTDYQHSKRGMKLRNDTRQQMSSMSMANSLGTMTVGATVNSTDSWVLVSGTHIKVTYVRELSGASGQIAPAGIYHVTTVTTRIGNHTGQASSGYVSPNHYVDEAAIVTLDNTIDTCLTGDSSCFENTSGTIFCTAASANIFTWGLTELIELAWSQSVWPGTPPVSPPGCSEPGPNYSSACYYTLQANCAINPPDFWVGHEQSGWNFTGASPAYWTSATFCFAPAILGKRVGPYKCPLGALSLPPHAGATQPPYNCTAKNAQGIN